MIRQLVSGNKRRFQEDGFDLDLSCELPDLSALCSSNNCIE
jgi:hypothetical protein